MCTQDVDWIANSVDTDQIAPLRAVWSGSTLYAKVCLSENLGSLLYCIYIIWANTVDQDKTDPRGAVWSGSTLFAIPSAFFGPITGVRMFRILTVIPI